MSFFARLCQSERPPGPESFDDIAALVREHPSPWSLSIDHAAFARHPDTPLEWLLSLAEEIPDVVLQNASLQMHLAMRSEQFSSAPLRCQLELISQWEIPPELIRLLAGTQSCHIELRVAAAKNPRCPEDLLWAYLGHSKRVRRAILDNPRAPRDVAREARRIERAQRRIASSVRRAHTAPPVPRVAQPPQAACEIDVLLPECPFIPAAPVSWSERWRRRSIHRRRRSV
jgi:hypothetical protein